MQALPIIYLAYMFVSMYFLAMFLMLYLRNRKTMFSYPEPSKKYSVSFIVPAYNEGKTIEDSLKHIFNVDYDIDEVIVVNDASTDNTAEVLERLKEKYPKLRVITHKKNSGSAAKAQNTGLRAAKGELVAVVDADSYPARDSIKKMAGFFDDKKVGAVTCPVFVRGGKKFIEKLQAIEYKVIAFSRKLLDYVDGIYVTPGPLALYRKEALLEIRGFDEKNLTQDIEATWALTAKGWDRRMSLSTHVTSTAPDKFWAWFKQRKRWNIGGLQCIYKHRKSFLKKGMLGYFIMPLFIFSTFLGLIGLSIFAYLIITRSVSRVIYTGYSIAAETPLVTLNDFYITPSFLNYLGVILFVFGLVFTLVTLAILKEKIFRRENLLNIPFYFQRQLVFPIIISHIDTTMMKG
jgi:biofilm PGA synthesis N-glycosyltransferase PgaC